MEDQQSAVRQPNSIGEKGNSAKERVIEMFYFNHICKNIAQIIVIRPGIVAPVRTLIEQLDQLIQRYLRARERGHRLSTEVL